jgi:hypothetical protein
MKYFSSILILTSLILIGLSSVCLPDDSFKRWNVYRQKGNCVISRQDWLTIAQDPPGFGWMLCNGSTSHPNFASAAAEMDFLKMTECQGETPLCPKFKNDCCKFAVYLNRQTGIFSVIREGGNAGPGQLIVQGDLCCEDAALLAGIPLGCTQLDLVSKPGNRVVRTEDGWASPMGPVTIETNPPFVVGQSPGGRPVPNDWFELPEDGEIPIDDPDDPYEPPDDIEDLPPDEIEISPPGEIEDLPPGEIEGLPPGEIEDLPPGEIEGLPPGEIGDPQPPKPPSTEDVDLSGTWVAPRDGSPGNFVMTLKRKNSYQYEGTWEIVAPSASSADRYSVIVEVARPGEGRLVLPFYSYDMTYTANQIVAGSTYRRQ